MRARLAALASAAALLCAASPAVSVGAWTDPTPATSTAAAHAVRAPSAVRCSVALLTVTLSWDEVDPRYDYAVTMRRLDNGALVSTRLVTGSETSATWLGLPALGLGLGAGKVDFATEVRSYLAASPTWVSAGATAAPLLQVVAGPVSATLSC